MADEIDEIIARAAGWIAHNPDCPPDCPYCAEELVDSLPKTAAIRKALEEAGYRIVRYELTLGSGR